MSSDRDNGTPPRGLPGASLEPGTGPAVPSLVTGLIEDGAGLGPPDRPVETAVREHLGHRRAWYGDLIGSLLLPASAAGGLSAALDAAAVPASPAGQALPVLLVATPAAGFPAAWDARVELTGIEYPADTAGTAGRADDPDVPVWIEVPRGPGAAEALAELAAGGAQNVALPIGGSSPRGFPGEEELAAFLRQAIDLDLAFRLTAGPSRPVRHAEPGSGRDAHGLLNVLCAVRAALNGAEVPEIAAVLAERRPAPLASAVRRISDADAAVLRAFCHAVSCPAVEEMVSGLTRLGLLERYDGRQDSG